MDFEKTAVCIYFLDFIPFDSFYFVPIDLKIFCVFLLTCISFFFTFLFLLKKKKKSYQWFLLNSSQWFLFHSY